MRLFTVLAERAPEVVSRDELIQEVWQGTFVSDEVLTQSISELRKALGDDPRAPRFIATVPKRGYQLVVEPKPEPPSERGYSLPKERIAWAILTALLLLALFHFARSPHAHPHTRFAVPAPDVTSETLEISPDGARLAFIAPDTEGKVRIWIHELETGQRRPLPGTEGAWHLFWSPDSRFIGFSTVSALKKIEVDGGALHTVRDTGFVWGGTWNARGDMVVSLLQLYRVHTEGGAPLRISPRTRLESNSLDTHPHFLPDGNHFLYFEAPPAGSGRIFVGSLASEEARFLLESDSKAVYADGFLLYVRSGALLARRFDARSMELGDETHVVGQQLISPAVVSRTDTPFSVSGNGVLAFRGTAGVDGQLVWFDRRGRELGRVPQPASGEYVNPRLSPDGGWIAVNWRDPVTGNVDIWLIEAATNVASRFISGEWPESDPVWSPDGKSIAFVSARKERSGVWVKEVAGGDERLVWEYGVDRTGLLLTDWSSDGRYLLCFADGDTWIVPVAEEGEARPIMKDVFELGSGIRLVHIYAARFSPDGEWIAYSSSETGIFEVHVMRVRDGRDKQRISNDGGVHPVWGADGRELFYWGGAELVGPLMRVEISTGPSGFRASTPVALFEPRIAGLLDSRNNFDVAPDGERFLLRRPSAHPSPITVIVNWSSALSDP
jgi:Tol biopolymer transport system component